MAIDDPQKALEAQLDAEKRAQSPLLNVALQIAGMLPMSFISEACQQWLEKEEKVRIEAFIETLGEEIRYLNRRMDSWSAECKDWARNEIPPLLLDASQKAQNTRFIKRARRIARILAHALDLGPLRQLDITEDLMRIAINLGDIEVKVLGELVDHQKPFFDVNSGRADYDSVNRYWSGVDRNGNQRPANERPAAKLGVTEGELQTACAKLQSFGLIVQIDRSTTFGRLGLPPFSILRHGIDFVESIGSFAETPE